MSPYEKNGTDPKTLGASEPQKSASFIPDDIAGELAQTAALGRRIVDFFLSSMDLAGLEIRLAVQTLPKLILIILLMVPLLLLVWCSFSVLIAWCVFTLTAQMGLGLLAFFVLQVGLFLICRSFFNKYCSRMTLPNTRAQIAALTGGDDELTRRNKAKE